MNLVIVGAGGIGAVHARHAVRLTGVTTYIVDTDPSKARDLAQRLGAAAISIDEAHGVADAAVVCVPTDFHATVARSFLERGKPVLIEKPLCRTVAEADSLELWANLIAVGQVVRFFSDHNQVHEAVARGDVGKPAAARLRRSGGKPRNWSGWFSDFDRSGGTLLDLAIHDFDWLRWTIGDVESVFACSAQGSDRSIDGDFALATLMMKSGAVCHVETSWMDTSFRTSIEVSGPKGCIEVDSRVNPTVRIEVPGAAQGFSPMSANDDPYARQLREFVKFACGQASQIATYHDGREALRISLAADESALSGQTIHL